MLTSLLLCLAPVQASVTPAEFSVSVKGLEISRAGLEWLEVPLPSSSIQVDLASGSPRSVGGTVVPLGSYDFVRVSIGAVMNYETSDPCGGGGVLVRQVDWSGDPLIDPDGDRTWDLCFATFESGGRADGTGTLEAPLKLDAPVLVEAGQDVPLRLILGISGLVVCDQGVVTVQRPTPGLSLASPSDTQELANQTWLVVGTSLDYRGAWPTLTSFQGELAFHANGRWSASDLQLRKVELNTGEGSACPTAWEGWWSATEGGDVWLSRTGSEAPLQGRVDANRQVLTLTSTSGGEEASVLWAVRRGPAVTEQPFEIPARLVLHDHGLVPVDGDPLSADLASWRLFARFSGTWGYTSVTETAWLNTLSIGGWIGGGELTSTVTSEWVPLHQGLSYTLDGPLLSLNALDPGASYSGWLSQDGRLGLLSRADAVAERIGLGLTLQTSSGLQNSSVQGLEFGGTFLEDAAQGEALRYSTGTVDLEFVTGVSFTLTTTHTGPGRIETLSTPGTYECWDEGRLVLRLADGRRFDGQVGPGRQTVILTSSEEDGLGGEDRLIGLLIRR